MRNRVTVLLGAVTVTGLLAGCVPDLATKAPAQAPTPVGFTDAYVARQDGAFTLPAIPVDQVPDTMERQVVAFETAEAPGTIIINPSARHLHLITGKNQAIRYGISVGRAGFEWAGEAIVANKRPWPTWTPPPEMIDRDPKLAKWEKGQPGGPSNPLGARAIYLTTNGVDYGYRIHGTPDWQSIGRSASSGCIRMINQDVVDLYERVQGGAKVVVLNADGTVPTKLKLPPPAPKKVKAKPAVVAPVPVAMPVLNPVLLGQVPPGLGGAPVTPTPVVTPPVVVPTPVVPAPDAAEGTN